MYFRHLHDSNKKYFNFFAEKFAVNGKIPTFAIPNEKKTFENNKFPNSSVG